MDAETCVKSNTAMAADPAIAHSFLKITFREAILKSVTQKHCGSRWLTPGHPVLCLSQPTERAAEPEVR